MPQNPTKDTIIEIDGYIVANDDQWIYEMFGYSTVTPGYVKGLLEEAAGGPVVVNIDSYGGDVYAGSDIYTRLMEYVGSVTVRVIGAAISAASVIAMAGRPTLMSPTAEMMIHNPWTRAEGDYRDLLQASESLKVSQETLVNAYMIKTGLPAEEIRAMLDAGTGDFAGTWMDAKQAVEKGFADGILFNEKKILDAAMLAGASTTVQAVYASARLPEISHIKQILDGRGLLTPNAPTAEPPAAPQPDPPNDGDETELLKARAETLALF